VAYYRRRLHPGSREQNWDRSESRLTRASSSDVGLMRRVEAKGDVAVFTRSRWVFQFIENRLIPSLTLERKWLLKKAGPSLQG